MISRALRLLTIGALLAGSGVHLAVMQSYAWAAMAARNMRSAPATEALSKTFDGRHPCGLCIKIQKAPLSPHSLAAVPAAGPLDLLLPLERPALMAKASLIPVVINPDAGQQRPRTVTTPPPRALQA